MKENYSENCNLIFEKEQQLSNIVEIELKEELSLVKKFERLNDERITPSFLQLAKTPAKSDSLDALCKDDGSTFEDISDRNSHIHKYYKDLYKLPGNNIAPNQNFKIEDFLGECADHPDIVNSKINENEKNTFDRPLGIEELDRSIKKAKKNTSPGGVGISNRFIEKNWNLFRVPLFK